MNDIVKEYITSGKDLREILNDRLKANDRKWIAIFILFSIIWVGYVCIINQRNLDLVTKNETLQHDKFVSDSIIENLQNKCSSAVYFKDITIK
jgi:hypothetical protein